MSFLSKLFFIFLSLLSLAHATPPKADEVFHLQTQLIDPNTFSLTWQINPGFFLYQKRIHLTPKQAPAFTLGEQSLPKAMLKTTADGHPVHIYRHHVTLAVHVLGKKAGEQRLTLHYQGCADDGFCYPPETRTLQFYIDNELGLKSISIIPNERQSVSKSETSHIESLFNQQYFWLTLLSFLGFGILLSFTPCVLPMFPVLSGIILQHKDNLTKKHAFMLSLSYVLGLSLTYALLGAGIAYLGNNFQLAFQSPWITGSFALFFIILALSMFDLFELRPPARWQHFIAHLSKQKWGGAYGSTLIMGAMSCLILSPCITPPLIGTLAYIAHTGNVFLGSIALFCLGLGQGLPLILLGTSFAHLLPKAGHWMYAIKACFGLLLLGLAIQLLTPILAPTLTMYLWGSLLLSAGVFFGALVPGYSSLEKARQSLGLILFILGVLILMGGSMGNHNPIQPLAGLRMTASPTSEKITVHNLSELKSQLANLDGQPVVLDFYADWCADCRAMEATTLQDPSVLKALKSVVWVKVDVTQNDADSKALMKAYLVVAPPTFIFLDAKHHEQEALRTVGLTSAETLEDKLNKLMHELP